jgi:phage terminase large subunit
MQVLILIALGSKGKVIEVAAKERASHQAKCLADFKDIMGPNHWELLNDVGKLNKTLLEYTFENGSIIRFIGLDSALKKRGQGRDILFINECNSFSYEDWIQLSMRTREQIYLDYNPSEYFWLDEHIIEQRKGEYYVIHSTYLDNYDFLPSEQINEIENLISAGDQYYIDVYVKGILGTFKGKIYTNYETVSVADYDDITQCEMWYGLDFGYEHNMVLMEFKYWQEKVYIRELFSESGKRVADHLIPFMEKKGIAYSDEIYCDSAMPGEIDKLRDAGFNARKADKSVEAGIRFCQQIKMYICADSKKTLKYIQKYKWKQDPDGKIYEGKPVKVDDDEMDAMRYGMYTHLKNRIRRFGIS